MCGVFTLPPSSPLLPPLSLVQLPRLQKQLAEMRAEREAPPKPGSAAGSVRPSLDGSHVSYGTQGSHGTQASSAEASAAAEEEAEEEGEGDAAEAGEALLLRGEGREEEYGGSSQGSSGSPRPLLAMKAFFRRCIDKLKSP